LLATKRVSARDTLAAYRNRSDFAGHLVDVVVLAVLTLNELECARTKSATPTSADFAHLSRVPFGRCGDGVPLARRWIELLRQYIAVGFDFTRHLGISLGSCILGLSLIQLTSQLILVKLHSRRRIEAAQFLLVSIHVECSIRFDIFLCDSLHLLLALHISHSRLHDRLAVSRILQIGRALLDAIKAAENAARESLKWCGTRLAVSCKNAQTRSKQALIGDLLLILIAQATGVTE